MFRFWVILAFVALLVSAGSLAVERSAPEIDLRLDSSEGTTSESPVEPQVPPLPSDSRAPVAFEKIGDGRGPGITAASAILVDADTGQILYSRKPHYRRPIASTTKIMTALLVLERLDLDKQVIASKAASLVPSSSLHLVPGEKIMGRDLLTAMMLRSANDAAYAFAERISGSVPRFCRLMNDKAKSLGLSDTNFKNPNGLYVPGHYSTAYDLSALAREAIKNPTFNEIAAMRWAKISRSKNTQDVYVFPRSPYMKHYPGADGIKSGYTKEAGHCYVGSATREGWRLISVVLKSGNASRDTGALMDYGFANFQRVSVAREGQLYPVKVSAGRERTVPGAAESEVSAVVARGRGQKVSVKASQSTVQAPVTSRQRVGAITVYVDGAPVDKIALVATKDVPMSFAAASWPWVKRSMFVLAAATLLANGSRRLRRGRAPAKNTLRRWRRFTKAIGRVNLGR